MQLPAEESKRHKIGHKLQCACRTQWLSTDKAVQGVWQDYLAIELTLGAEEFNTAATAIALLSQLKTVKFIGKNAPLLYLSYFIFVQCICFIYRGHLHPQVYSFYPGNN